MMKDLQPAMKDSTRYLKFKVHAEKDADISDIVEVFWDTTTRYMGTEKLSRAQPWLIANKFDEEQQEGVIRVKRDYVTDLRAALVLVDSFESENGFVTIEKTSGNISKL